MANRVITQRLIDTHNRALIKYAIFPDGTATANTSVIKFSELRYAINATGAVSNTNPKASYNVSIKRVYGQMAGMANSFVKLSWEDDANTEILSMGSGMFDYDMVGNAGDGAVIKDPAANSAGLLYSITNPNANMAITFFVDMRKDSTTFDAGQSNDPIAFNRGPAAGP